MAFCYNIFMSKFWKIFTVIVVLLSVFVIYLSFLNKKEGKVQSVKINNQEIKVEIADTPALREQGLSGHKPLADNEGMLFVFDHAEKYNFWMKDMLFPIDIIWLAPRSLGEAGIDSDFKIVDITKNVSPDTYPKTFAPILPAQYVLEVSAGLADKYSWQIGDQVKF